MNRSRQKIKWKAWLIASILCTASIRQPAAVFGNISDEGISGAVVETMHIQDGIYRIESFEELREFSKIVLMSEEAFSQEVWLMCDIIADGELQPIGDALHRFEGVFDGRGHVIEGLRIDGSGEFQGLFGYVGNNGCIKNVTLKNTRIIGSRYVGGIAAYSSGRIENCRAEQVQIINRSRLDSAAAVGGIVGMSCGKVIRCAAENVFVAGNCNVGGIAGSQHAQEMSLCISSGNIVGYSSARSRTGGITGSLQTGATVKGCISLCNVYARGEWTGGVAGDMQSGKMLGCLAMGEVNGKNAGGVIGYAGQRTQVIRCAYIEKRIAEAADERHSGVQVLCFGVWDPERNRTWIKQLLDGINAG